MIKDVILRPRVCEEGHESENGSPVKSPQACNADVF
jgi:hypothetical protein